MRAAIGAALQETALDPFLSGREHLRLQASLHGIRGASGKELIDRCSRRVGLTSAGDRKIRTYSGGMKRRLDLALVADPRPVDPLPRRADDRASTRRAARRSGRRSAGSRATRA